MSFCRLLGEEFCRRDKVSLFVWIPIEDIVFTWARRGCVRSVSTAESKNIEKRGDDKPGDFLNRYLALPSPGPWRMNQINGLRVSRYYIFK
jgi:hypothetical protein